MTRSATFRLIFLACASLASCASPSPAFMQGQRLDAEVDGSRFTIWRAGEAVEVYRVSTEVLPKRSETFAKASVAIRRVTGCAVVPGSLAGDVALMEAEIDCG